MNYILDTHALLWALFDHTRLSEKASSVILDPDNEINVSLVTFWEIALKYNLGKLTLEGVAPEELPSYAEKAGFEILGITAEEASSFYKLPRLRHHDPFDRMIIWQCIRNNMCLITRDSGINDYADHGLKTVW
ncbi:MAG: type II toxin-antitoxin system VapC family toxin [Spirochaetes bacterium]|nr:type II toxin-antitoxin system VapC family toxin [Spirochaetota bacterium]